MDLFSRARDSETDSWRPLAERRRPETLDDIVGQAAVCGDGSWIREALNTGHLGSLIFWGPPGCGKTTLGRILARESGMEFSFFSAATDGLKELRSIVAGARDVQAVEGRRTLLFCDEIHRLNKGQQDAFLPHVESGLLTLVGATTENPSFEVNSALLSRCRVIVIEPLTADDIRTVIAKALEADATLKASGLDPPDDVVDLLVSLADGDARRALTMLESLLPFAGREISAKKALEVLHKPARFDKGGEAHYDQISCLHKAVRASDVQATIYWTVRLLESGEDPKYVARRLVRMATEDVGLADPGALTQCMDAARAVDFLGSPEGHLALVQAAIYLASAPKSNTAYLAEKAARAVFKQTGDLPPPKHILNAPTSLMKELGYGSGYQYDHDCDNRFSGQECLPEELKGTSFYEPGEFGYEKEIEKRLEWWRSLREKGQ